MSATTRTKSGRGKLGPRDHRRPLRGGLVGGGGALGGRVYLLAEVIFRGGGGVAFGRGGSQGRVSGIKRGRMTDTKRRTSGPGTRIRSWGRASLTDLKLYPRCSTTGI